MEPAHRCASTRKPMGRKEAGTSANETPGIVCGELDLCVLMNRVDIERLNLLIGLSSSG